MLLVNLDPVVPLDRTVHRASKEEAEKPVHRAAVATALHHDWLLDIKILRFEHVIFTIAKM